MTNKITYQEAIETLQAMFSSLDEETLKSVLVMNKGLLEPTIECLLKLAGEDENEQQKSMFNPGGGNNNDFNDDPFYLNSLQKNQEDEDRAIAYKLQQKYIQRANYYEQEEEKYKEHHQNKPKKGPKQNMPAPMKPQFEDKEIINDEEDDLHINVKPFKKEKKSFKEKMKSAKESFMSIFKKKKKAKAGFSSNIQNPESNKPQQQVIAFEEDEEDNDAILLPSSNSNNNNNNNNSQKNNLYPDL